MPLHEKTWGAHSCFLALGEQLLFSCEDIGRHNAIDKAVGYALKNGLSLEYCILYKMCIRDRSYECRPLARPLFFVKTVSADNLMRGIIFR